MFHCLRTDAGWGDWSIVRRICSFAFFMYVGVTLADFQSDGNFP